MRFRRCLTPMQQVMATHLDPDEVIEAVQYHWGQIPLPPSVTELAEDEPGSGDHLDHIRAYVRNHPDGPKLPLRDGDWVIGQEGGVYIMSNEKFTRRFVACE